MEQNKEKDLAKFFEENKIAVDKNGNFEVYVVVDADDKDHETGVIICGKETEAYAEKRAYEDLNTNQSNCSYGEAWLYMGGRNVGKTAFTQFYNGKPLNKKKTIREDLLKMEDRIFRVSTNIENVFRISKNRDTLLLDKYKVVTEVLLAPKIEIVVTDIDNNNEKTYVTLYNSLSGKYKEITLQGWFSSLDDIRFSVNEYLERNEWEVEIVNSTLKGVEL